MAAPPPQRAIIVHRAHSSRVFILARASGATLSALHFRANKHTRSAPFINLLREYYLLSSLTIQAHSLSRVHAPAFVLPSWVHFTLVRETDESVLDRLSYKGKNKSMRQPQIFVFELVRNAINEIFKIILPKDTFSEYFLCKYQVNSSWCWLIY